MQGRGALVALAVIVAAAVAALAIARPEPVPGHLVPPERSAASQAKATAEPTEAAADTDAPEEQQPQKGYSMTRLDLEQGLLKVRSHAQGCRDEGVPPVVPLKIVIAPSGNITSVGLPPEVRGTQGGDCIVRAIRQASFPAWSQPSTVTQLEWTYPLRMDGVD